MNPATHQRICAEIQERHQREIVAVVAQRDELEKLCNYNERVMQELLQQRDELAAALEKLARLGNEPHYGNSIGNQIARDALAKVGAGTTAEPDCDRSACGDFSPGRCDNPECPALRHNVELRGGPAVSSPERPA